MSSWFGDGFTSLKGQLTNFAKVLTEDLPNSNVESSSKQDVSESQGKDDNKQGKEGNSSLQENKETESGTHDSGWTDVQLVHPNLFPSGNEEEKEVQRIKGTEQSEIPVKEIGGSSQETEKDVGSIIRGGFANLIQIYREGDQSSNPQSEDSSNITRRDQEVQTDLSQDQAALLIASLQDRVEQLTLENESLSLNVSNLGQAAAELEAQVAISQDVNSNLSTGLEELDIQHQRAIENVIISRDETQKEYDILRIKYGELEAELKAIKSKNEGLDEEEEGSRDRRTQLVRELEERDHELECLEGENTSLREILRDLMKEQEEKSKETLAPINEQDSEELEALERMVEQLKKDLKNSENIVNEKDKKIDEMDKNILLLKSDVELNKSLEESIKAKELEIKTEIENRMILENKLADVETKLTLLANAKAESESLVEHLQSQLETSNNYNMDTFPESQEKLSCYEEQNRLLQSKLNRLESCLLEASDKRDHLQKECESKDRKMCQILLESNTAEQECKKELEIQEIKYSQLIEEYKSFKISSENEIKIKISEIEKLQSCIEADNEIIVDNAVNSELNEKLSLLEQENENLMTESKKIKLDYEDLLSNYKSVNERTEKAEKDLLNAKNESLILKEQYNFDLRSMESKVNELAQESQQYHIDKEVFNQKEIELKNQLKLRDEEISAFKICKQQTELAFKEKLLSMESDNKTTIEEKDKMLETLNEVQNELDSLKLNFEENSNKYEENIQVKELELMKFKENIEIISKEKSKLSEEITKLQHENKSLSLEKLQLNNEQYEAEREVLVRKIESITEQKAQLLTDLENVNSDHKAMKNHLEISHNEEIKMLEEKLLSQNELKTTMEQLRTECSEMKNKLSQTEIERDELLQNIQLKHNECAGFQMEIARLSDIIKSQQIKTEALAVEKAHLEIMCEGIKATEMESESNKKEIADLTEEVKRLQEQLANASDLLKETKRTEAEGQSAEDTSTKNFKCLEGCEKTHEELNKLSWALHNEQMNNKSLQRQLVDVKEKFEKSEVQLRRLQVHLMEVEQNQSEEQNEMEQMKAKLDVAEERLRQSSTAFTSANIRANQQVESLAHQVQTLLETKERLETELSNAEDSFLKQQAAVTNLQAVLHQFQIDKQKDVEFETERLRQQLEDSHDRYEQLNNEMKKTIDQMNGMKKGLDAASRLSEQLDKKSHVIETLKSEATVLKEKLEKEKEKIKEIHSSVEGKIDRNLIKNLVMGYMSADERSKTQVLKVLASVLELDVDERKKLSLEPQTHQQQQSLSEAFIKFLENESQPKPQLVLSVPQTPPEGGASRKTSQSSNSSILLSAEASSTLSHSPVIPSYTLRSNHSILKDLLKDTTPQSSNNPS